MKTIGRFFLLTATVALLFSCSATGFNIFGNAPVDTDGISEIIEGAGSSASNISASLSNLENVSVNGSSITITINEKSSVTVNTGLASDAKVYGNDSNITEELAKALDGGNGDALVEDLAGKELSDDEATILKNTSTMYSTILSDPDINGKFGDFQDEIKNISDGLSELISSENLTQADAVLVQSMTSVTYTLLSSVGTISESSFPEFLQTPEAENVIDDLGLIVTYSKSLADSGSAGSALAGSFNNLYESLKGSIGGNAQ